MILGLIAHVVYNIYFHPLAKFPGPRLLAATSFIYWSKWVGGDLIPFYDSVHKEYGEIVRIAPNRLSFTNPQAWKDIYGHKSSKQKASIKDPSVYGPEMNGHYSLISIKDDAEHNRVRRIFNHAFSDKALRDQEDLFRIYVDKLIRNVYNTEGGAFDAVKAYNCTTFDIMAELTFGESLGLLDKSEYNHWLSSILGSLKFLAYKTLLGEFPPVAKMVELFVPKALKDAEKEVFEYSAQRVAKRLEKGAVTERPDIWSLVLGMEEGPGLNVEEMDANATLFMVAGSETTATILSGVTYYLLLSPDKMRRLVEEIRGAFSNEGDLTIGNLRQLKYLQACFDEGLRGN